MNENTSTAPSPVDMVYLPSPSVVVPVDVPFTTTLTPGIDAPCESETLPDTVLWANADALTNSNSAKLKTWYCCFIE
jgi:hypothetical protein